MGIFERDFEGELFDYDPDYESDWGAGLSRPHPSFPPGRLVTFTQTTTGASTVGEHELVVKDEVGTITRQGAGRMLVRLDRRSRPFSAYFPTTVLRPLEEGT